MGAASPQALISILSSAEQASPSIPGALLASSRTRPGFCRQGCCKAGTKQQQHHRAMPVPSLSCAGRLRHCWPLSEARPGDRGRHWGTESLNDRALLRQLPFHSSNDIEENVLVDTTGSDQKELNKLCFYQTYFMITFFLGQIILAFHLKRGFSTPALLTLWAG